MMKTSTKLIIGGGLVATTGLAFYTFKKHKDSTPAYQVQEYIFDLKEDAEIVLDQLKETAEKYTHVTVADYLDLIGEGSSYILHSYGWDCKALSKAKIKKHRRGFIIKFPKVVEIQ